MTWIKVDTRIRSASQSRSYLGPFSMVFRLLPVLFGGLSHRRVHPKRALRHIVPDAKRPRSAAESLVLAGLWERVDGGYRIHDYADYQRSSADDDGGGSRARAQAPAGTRAAAPARTRSRARARTQTRAPEEVEVEEEKTPPYPPKGGRQRDRISYEGKLAEFSATHFPGVDAGYVAHYASQLRSRRTEPTVEMLRPLLEPHRQPLL